MLLIILLCLRHLLLIIVIIIIIIVLIIFMRFLWFSVIPKAIIKFFNLFPLDHLSLFYLICDFMRRFGFLSFLRISFINCLFWNIIKRNFFNLVWLFNIKPIVLLFKFTFLWLFLFLFLLLFRLTNLLQNLIIAGFGRRCFYLMTFFINFF